MSAGAFMATRLACDRADLVSAVAPVSGTLGVGVNCAPSRPVSLLLTHGTGDTVVPYGGGPMVGRGGASEIISAPALVDRFRQIDGCPGPLIEESASGPVQRMDAAGCAGGSEVALVRIDGGPHIWPSAVDASQASASSSPRTDRPANSGQRQLLPALVHLDQVRAASAQFAHQPQPQGVGRGRAVFTGPAEGHRDVVPATLSRHPTSV